ncbi:MULTISPECIES: hypothetical protein [unclassified Agrobacterium]|uniref:hypothetical protein n=1 Tax=unclassified Agrobacterium TaxID=2632611 RepID=UPI00244C34B6|nr:MULTISPECIES: hypothetical protein [unclassified Agrobacterium]MDH0611877.1 hypothetical protein [Agrobacterium sp. GD03872]MDH0695774.1 hypothetical protein [Agrobacterium sp. GD03871]MDH1058952.1 hypothetical protein [Agrobacterium sp. GD03992]MDH2211043.1 hypothetical protein [Agrobacterium sp. GD03643]MDH2217540.1 hypothetical protein [Agrobacterium sp. GD03638]
MMKLARFIWGLFAIVAFLGLLTIDHWFSIGERAQGGYSTRTPAEQAEAEARSSAAEDEARKAADGTLKIMDGGDAERNGTR